MTVLLTRPGKFLGGEARENTGSLLKQVQTGCRTGPHGAGLILRFMLQRICRARRHTCTPICGCNPLRPDT